ncbi:hypothetical protein PSAC2689_60346 [Paraburkholderia sacchari]|uniref:hypothetical protein n=1 Tax=Paraburkholderia sacchari TaxID=159450 RepID=UPI0039A47594
MSEHSAHKGDFATDVRLLRISAIAAVGGALSTVAADFLLHLIGFFTNLFFFPAFKKKYPACLE